MTPMHVRCPECRASLHLLVQLLPARATCTHCRAGFTIAPAQAAAPPQPTPAPAAPPTMRPAGRPARFLRALVALVLLAALLGASIIVLVNVCFSGDALAPEAGPARDRVSPHAPHPISQRFRGK
jgi:hypothetical protein